MLRRCEKKKIPILMYHSISDTDNARFRQFAVSPALFAEQMVYLHQHGYTPVTVTQFITARSQERAAFPVRPVILTFDDGFADFYSNALPVLRQYGFVATLYISTAFINGTSRWLRHEQETTRPILTWKQLTEIRSADIECGAHSHSHPQLDTLPSAAAREEILRSKRLLEDYLSCEICSFAYPFGYYTSSIRHMVQEAGFTSACAVRHTLSSEADDAFSLARLMVRPDAHEEAFAALLTGRSSSLAAATYRVYARARTPLWQAVRRSGALVKQKHGTCRDAMNRVHR